MSAVFKVFRKKTHRGVETPPSPPLPTGFFAIFVMQNAGRLKKRLVGVNKFKIAFYYLSYSYKSKYYIFEKSFKKWI